MPFFPAGQKVGGAVGATVKNSDMWVNSYVIFRKCYSNLNTCDWCFKAILCQSVVPMRKEGVVCIFDVAVVFIVAAVENDVFKLILVEVTLEVCCVFDVIVVDDIAGMAA